MPEVFMKRKSFHFLKKIGRASKIGTSVTHKNFFVLYYGQDKYFWRLPIKNFFTKRECCIRAK
jgi:hypothetical protein